eukprot:scaffold28155_cov171-Skeletonema_menzelii.AAC.1
MAAPIRMHHAAGIDVNLFFSSAVEFSIGGGSYWGGNIALPVTEKSSSLKSLGAQTPTDQR